MYFNVLKITIVFTVVSAYPKVILNVSNMQGKEFPFYSRAEWGAEPSNDTRILITPVPYLVMHHTYIPAACSSFEECSQAMRSMQRYHSSLGWGDIGYNFCVGSDGGVYEGRGWHTIGIHAGHVNSQSIGVCLIGDWRTEKPPKQMLESTKSLMKYGLKLGVLGEDYKLVGHNQSMATECPGNALYKEFKTWKHFSPDKV